jgi:hypothetical protein
MNEDNEHCKFVFRPLSRASPPKMYTVIDIDCEINGGSIPPAMKLSAQDRAEQKMASTTRAKSASVRVEPEGKQRPCLNNFSATPPPMLSHREKTG